MTIVRRCWQRRCYHSHRHMGSCSTSEGLSVNPICLDCVAGARDGRKSTLSIDTAKTIQNMFRMTGYTVTLGRACGEPYTSLSSRLQTIYNKRARAAGQQTPWLTSVDAEQERLGAPRNVSIKKRPATQSEKEVADHVVGPVEAPADAETT